MYYLVENWQQTEMDVIYCAGDRAPREDRWRVLGVYRSSIDAWAAYRDLMASDAILKPSDRYMRAL